MQFFEKLSQKWNALCEKAKPTTDKIGTFFAGAGRAARSVWIYVVKLRKIILAVPVAWCAISLALRNLRQLPEVVGLFLQSDGTFAVQIARVPAVLAPLLVTAVCLLLMFGSRRILTPWLVSVLSLALPVVVLVINIFPA